MTRTRGFRLGFTLIELMVVVSIMGILAVLVITQGRSTRQNAGLASGAYEMMLRIQELKGRAISENTAYLLVIVDSANRAACAQTRNQCARYFVLKDPKPTFAIDGFDPAAPAANALYDDGDFLPRGSVLDLASGWTPPAPFNAVTPWNPAIRTNCSGRTCFALRFTSDGEVLPEPPAPINPIPAGFTFVVSPIVADGKSSERRAIFVSFPAGIVKTAAF